MTLQEGPPSLGRRLPSAHQVLADAGFADVNAKFEQLAVDTGRAPQGGFPGAGDGSIDGFLETPAADWPGPGALSRSKTGGSLGGAKRSPSRALTMIRARSANRPTAWRVPPRALDLRGSAWVV